MMSIKNINDIEFMFFMALKRIDILDKLMHLPMLVYANLLPYK